nr:calmodulin-like [Procambarus clarkii]
MTNPTMARAEEEGGVRAKDLDRSRRTTTPAHRQLSHNISKAQLKELREAFRLFDKDGDGTITKQELGQFMRNLGQFATEEELRVMLDEIDIDGE